MMLIKALFLGITLFLAIVSSAPIRSGTANVTAPMDATKNETLKRILLNPQDKPVPTVTRPGEPPDPDEDPIGFYEWAHPNNRIPQLTVCLNNRFPYIPTVYTADDIWTAMNNALSYSMDPPTFRPGIDGRFYPRRFEMWHAGLSECNEGHLAEHNSGRRLIYPLQPGGYNWPGGPPGRDFILLDIYGVYGGAFRYYRRGRARWCIPIYLNGRRDNGAANNGVPGVDEGDYIMEGTRREIMLSANNPMFGSVPLLRGG